MSNNLKELTKAHHDNAERTAFADMLLGGEISPRLYQMYLHAQLQNYMALESAVTVPIELEPIFRSAQIEQDLQEIESLRRSDSGASKGQIMSTSSSTSALRRTISACSDEIDDRFSSNCAFDSSSLRVRSTSPF